jgi:hypothetical protein
MGRTDVDAVPETEGWGFSSGCIKRSDGGQFEGLIRKVEKE